MRFSVAAILGLPALGLGAAVPAPETKPLFTRRDVSIAEAPAEHQFSLWSHPSPGAAIGSPRARIAKFQRKKAARSRQRPQATGSGSEVVNTIFSGVYPVVNITWGSKQALAGGADPSPQQFISFIDTGSADTWAVSQRLQCLDIDTRKPRPQAACGFGPLWDSGVGSFQNITDQGFSIGYFPENETLEGDMGYAPISIGGLTVPKQEVALVTKAAWVGDGASSGLLGLAYPPLTSAYNRTTKRSVQYDPVFTTMVKQKIVDDAVFTLALDRVPQGTSPLAPAGLLALGGLVPPEYYEGAFTSVPIEATAGSGKALTWYTTTHEFVYKLSNGTRVSAGTYQSIVDSGTAPNFVPTAAAEELNAQFIPAAVYNSSLGYWTVDCGAKAPYAAFVIGGVEMPMDPRDMIVPSLNGLPGYENVCFSAFADGGDPDSDVMLIGEVWQLSYVVAYDQGRKMMHFAKRAQSTSRY